MYQGKVWRKSVIIILYDYRNKLFASRLIARQSTNPLAVMFVATSSLTAPMCVDPKIEQKILSNCVHYSITQLALQAVSRNRFPP